MASGYLQNGVCHETTAEAYAAHFAALPRIIELGTPSQSFTYIFADGIWQQRLSEIDTNGTETVLFQNPAPLPQLLSCLTDAERFQDGVDLGWGVASVIIAVTGIAMLRRAL